MTAPAAQDMRTQLEEGLTALALPRNADDVERLLQYIHLLDRWNAVHNLTAVRDPRAMLTQHLLDSLAIHPLLPPCATVLDVGTGAGLPGIPLQIVRDDLSITMIDSHGKKTAFVQHAISTLRLVKATPVTARVEKWRPSTGFQIVVSRALSDLATFTRLTRHLLETGGRWIALKGQRPDDELASLPSDIAVLDVRRLHVPMLEGERHAVVLALRNPKTERSQ